MPYDDFRINTDDPSDSVQVDVTRAQSVARTPQSRDFQSLSIMMTGCGGLISLMALPLVLFSGSRLPGGIMLLVGVSYLVTGFGFSGYHRWAWYVTVVLVAGLRHVESMKHLRKLNLAGTDIDDDGLKHLRGLKNLQRLAVTDTRVTSDGVESLREFLPLCRVIP